MPDNAPTSPDAFGPADIDADSRAELDALLAGLEAARGTKIGFPDATDFDYTDLAPFLRFLLNNLGDPQADGLYPWHTKPMEREVVGRVADLLRAPAERWGYVTGGGEDGIEWALWQARRRHPGALVYSSAAAHHAIDGVVDRLAMTRVSVRADGHGEIDYDDLADQLDRHRDRPAVIVANIGAAAEEAIDDVRRIRAVLDDRAVLRCWVHCDAALSGLPLALIEPDQRPGMDFVDGADSINVSGHKFIGTPEPSGVVVVRAGLCDQGRTATYTGAADVTVTNSRSGFAVLLLWYALRRHGVEGLRSRAEQARELAAYAHGRMVAIGWAGVHRHPHAFTVTFDTPPPHVVAKWCLPGDRGRSRLVCMPGMNQEQIDAFIRDLVASRDVTPEPADRADRPTAPAGDRRRSGRLRDRLLPASSAAREPGS